MGGVVHFEIPADDQERARKFYQEALGWRIDAVPGMGYFAYFKDTENNIMGLWENLPPDQQAQASG